jgi:hypothetical protein
MQEKNIINNIDNTEKLINFKLTKNRAGWRNQTFQQQPTKIPY